MKILPSRNFVPIYAPVSSTRECPFHFSLLLNIFTEKRNTMLQGRWSPVQLDLHVLIAVMVNLFDGIIGFHDFSFCELSVPFSLPLLFEATVGCFVFFWLLFFCLFCFLIYLHAFLLSHLL